MRFLNPMPCRCASCQAEAKISVNDLLALTAHCPSCGASFRETGLEMRRGIGDACQFFHSIVIIMHMEDQLGIEINDELIASNRSWDDVTLDDLATAARLATPQNQDAAIPQVLAPAQVSATASGDPWKDAVIAAVRAKFPKAPEVLDFSAPICAAIAPELGRDYYQY